MAKTYAGPLTVRAPGKWFYWFSRRSVIRTRPQLQSLPQACSRALDGTVLVHGHCHQKALTGMNTEIGLLRKGRGLRVEAPDAGCCGMAGAFGYDVRRFEVSRTIAHRVLVPAIKKSAEDALIIAD